MEEKKINPPELEEERISSSLKPFLESIQFKEGWFGLSDIRGDVLVVGCSAAIPERSLICQPPDFRKMRPAVNFLTLLDPQLRPLINFLFSEPALRISNPESLKSSPPQGRVVYGGFSLQEALPQIPKASFDTILFFRIPNLSEQLRSLMEGISVILKPKGKFIGSGSFNSVDEARGILSSSLTVKTLKELSNLDSSGFFYSPQNIGFFCQKQP